MTLLLGGGCLPSPEPQVTQIEQPASPPPITPTASKTVTSDNGFAFTYPAVYTISNNSSAADESYLLIHEDDVRPEGFVGEGGPPIQVAFWKNRKDLSLTDWAEQNKNESGFYAGTPAYEQISVAGKDAIRFEAEGLYPIKYILIEHENGVLLLAAAYSDTAHPNLETFETMLKTVTFEQ